MKNPMKYIFEGLENETDAYLNIFKFPGNHNILHEDNFGIVNGLITAGVNYRNVFSISGLWAPPYVSSNFFMNIRIFGQKIPCGEYTWLPFAVISKGVVEKVRVTGTVMLVNGARAMIVSMLIENTSSEIQNIPIQIHLEGGIDYVHLWDFNRPYGVKSTDLLVGEDSLLKYNNNKAIAVKTDIPGPVWHAYANIWEAGVTLAASSSAVYNIVVAIGEKQETISACESIFRDPQKAADDTISAYRDAVKSLFEKLPSFHSSNERLNAFYNRSLVHYITNRWETPEFIFSPMYTAGSVKGGCLANYLWDYSAAWELQPLVDPEELKRHIKHYLELDITNCFSFDPISGVAIGPWYPVNQEKIVGLVYYYVLHTGDTAFLTETAGNKSVLDWVIYHTSLNDDLNKPVELYDFGYDGEHHLELRKGIPYHGVMPDLNGRRYLNYIRAAELLEQAGQSGGVYRKRAEDLKTLFKKELWSPEDKWYYFITNREKQLRYTGQMYELFAGAVMGTEEREGLLGHLNTDEFLSDYGFHSVSKTDPAYDQIDIDEGGGGNCTIFPTHIAELLYKAGYPDQAADMLERILWWGEKTPYWGDSFVANYVDYRADTPLQCEIGGVTGAQAIIFGMFGVKPEFDGSLSINPAPPSFARVIELKGLRLRGNVIDVMVDGKEFTVWVNGQAIRSQVGTPVCYKADITAERE